MPIEVTYSEINGIVEVISSYATRRIIYLLYQVPSVRIVDLNYKLSLGSERKCHFQTNPVSSDRLGISGKAVAQVIETSDGYIYLDYFTYNSSVFGFTPRGLPGYNERIATTIPNAQVIVSTTQLILPITYQSDRNVVIGYSPNTQRIVVLVIPVSDFRYGTFIPYRESRLTSPKIQSSIQVINDRYCYVETLQKYTNRFGCYVTRTETERYGWFYTYQQGILNSPKIQLTLTEISTERKVYYQLTIPRTERIALVQRVPDSSRFATFNYSTNTERTGTYYTTKYVLIHDTQLCQCRPFNSERFGFAIGYQYYSERYSLYRTGEKYIVKKPALSGKFQVLSYRQDKTQFKLFNTEKVEAYSNSLGLSQINLDNPNLYEIAGSSENQNVVVRAVESVSGSALSDTTEKKEKVLHYGKFIASLYYWRYVERYGFVIGGSRISLRNAFTSGFDRFVDDRSSIVTPYNFTDRNSITGERIIRATDDRNSTFNYYDLINTERQAISVYIVTDERYATYKPQPFAIVVSDDGSEIYRLYESDDSIILKQIEGENVESSYLTDRNQTTAYQLKLVDDELTAVEVTDKDPEIIGAPIVTNLDDETKQYKLYYEDGEFVLVPIES